MSNVKGRIAVDVQFTDSTSSEGVQSLKSITLQDATEYTTGKVAIFTGIVGTAANVGISLTSPMIPSYRDSTGEEVAFESISRIAFQTSRDCKVFDVNFPENSLRSRGAAAVSDWTNQLTFFEIEPLFTAGTASYTLVLYGT